MTTRPSCAVRPTTLRLPRPDDGLFPAVGGHLAGAGATNIAPLRVNQENLGMVDVGEALDDQIDHAIHERLQVAFADGIAADLLRGFDVPHALLHLPGEVGDQVLHLLTHVHERGGDLTKLVPALRRRERGRIVASGHGSDRGQKLVERRDEQLREQQAQDHQQRHRTGHKREAQRTEVFDHLVGDNILLDLRDQHKVHLSLSLHTDGGEVANHVLAGT
jgi:hypothetical protein